MEIHYADGGLVRELHSGVATSLSFLLWTTSDQGGFENPLGFDRRRARSELEIAGRGLRPAVYIKID